MFQVLTGAPLRCCDWQVLWSTWAPPAERSRLSAIPQVGGYVGTIVQLAIAGFQIDHPELGSWLGGWPGVFYFNAILGLLWVVLWWFTAFDTPHRHPRLDVRERQCIERALLAEARHGQAAAAAAAGAPISLWQLYWRMLSSRESPEMEATPRP